MGMLFRLLAPKPVRRARRVLHPVSTVRRAATPRPVKQATSLAHGLLNPVDALGNAAENVVVDALSPGQRRRSSRSAANHGQAEDVERRRAERSGRIQEALRAEEVLQEMLLVRTLVPSPAKRPLAPAAVAVDGEAVVKRFERAAVRGLAFYRRGQRRAAKCLAQDAAACAIQAEQGLRSELQQRQQEQLDDAWGRLLVNDPSAVHAALTCEFARASDALSVVRVGGRSATIVVGSFGVASIPSEAPSVTPTGRPTTRKRSQSERNDLYAELLAGIAIGSARHVLAVAPALKEVEVVLIAHPEATPVLYARIPRGRLERVSPTLAAIRQVEDASDEFCLERKGRTQEVRPIALNAALRALVDGRSGVGGNVRNPFDLVALAAEQEALAESESARLDEYVKAMLAPEARSSALKV